MQKTNLEVLILINIGIDLSKYKHDCFIFDDSSGEVIADNFSFENNKKGFQQFLDLLKSYNSSNVHIGFEATGHYGMNLKLFLENNHFTYMEFNPLLVKEFAKSLTLRKTKTDKADACVICQKLMSVPYKPNSPQFYHKFCLKSLSRTRDTLVKERSKYLVFITNILDLTFPEFKPFFNNKFSVSSIYILSKYMNAENISRMRDFDSIRKVSHGRFSYASFANLKELAKNTVGESNDILEFQLQSLLELYEYLNSKIVLIDKQISTIVKDLNPPMLSIPGIGEITCAAIISEFGDLSNFGDSGKALSFAGAEPSIIQSGTLSSNGKMVKHGSGHLRYHLLQAAEQVKNHCPYFYDYYLKKLSEGKSYRVAISHTAKKLLRMIYHLETTNTLFDSSLLK